MGLGDIKEYITKHLSALQDTRNKVLGNMLSQVQTEREWQHSLESLNEQRNKYLSEQRLKQEQEKVKEQAEKANATPLMTPKLRNAQSMKDRVVRQGKKLVLLGSDNVRKPQSKPLKMEKSRTIQLKTAVKEESKRAEESDGEIDEAKKAAKPVQLVDDEQDRYMWEFFKTRYEGSADTIKMICNLKSLPFVAEDLQSSTRNI